MITARESLARQVKTLTDRDVRLRRRVVILNGRLLDAQRRLANATTVTPCVLCGFPARGGDLCHAHSDLAGSTGAPAALSGPPAAREGNQSGTARLDRSGLLRGSR